MIGALNHAQKNKMLTPTTFSDKLLDIRVYAVRPRRNSIKDIKKMPLNPATTVDTTPDRRLVTFRMVDAEGGLKAFSYPVPSTTTDAQINAVATAYGVATNAYVYQIVVSNEFGSDIALPANAVDAPRVSVEDVVNVLYKSTSPTAVPIRLELFAPITAILDGKIVDQSNADLQALATAFDSAIAFAGLGYGAASFGFTERRKRNPRQRPIA